MNFLADSAPFLCLKQLTFNDDGSWNCIHIKIMSVLQLCCWKIIRTDISAFTVFMFLCALYEVILLRRIEYLTEICAAKLLLWLRLNLLLGVRIKNLDFLKKSCCVNYGFYSDLRLLFQMCFDMVSTCHDKGKASSDSVHVCPGWSVRGVRQSCPAHLPCLFNSFVTLWPSIKRYISWAAA